MYGFSGNLPEMASEDQDSYDSLNDEKVDDHDKDEHQRDGPTPENEYEDDPERLVLFWNINRPQDLEESSKSINLA